MPNKSNDLIPSSKVFECRHIRKSDNDIIQHFTAKDEKGRGLEQFLKEDALSMEEENLERTYIVMDKSKNELVGFFSLKASSIQINVENKLFAAREFDSLPTIELSNLGSTRIILKLIMSIQS
jgi:hypothetical protein